MVDRTDHVRLGESDRELEDQEQDIRGWPVQDEAGGTIGTVSDLMLNTDTELVGAPWPRRRCASARTWSPTPRP